MLSTILYQTAIPIMLISGSSFSRVLLRDYCRIQYLYLPFAHLEPSCSTHSLPIWPSNCRRPKPCAQHESVHGMGNSNGTWSIASCSNDKLDAALHFVVHRQEPKRGGNKIQN